VQPQVAEVLATAGLDQRIELRGRVP